MGNQQSAQINQIINNCKVFYIGKSCSNNYKNRVNQHKINDKLKHCQILYTYTVEQEALDKETLLIKQYKPHQKYKKDTNQGGSGRLSPKSKEYYVYISYS